MELNIGSIKLPLNAATKTFAVLAKRGAGKTYASAVLFEEFQKNGIPCVVFDPIDVWWGLRLAANGRDKGLPVVVFGLEHADIQINRDMGRLIAQAVVRENISCIISTFGMPKVAQRHLIAEFSEEILNINNRPRHIFIEEAHEFVPQRVFGGLGRTFNAVSNLIVMGRNKGIGVTLINQRAATLNKDVLTQLDTLIALRNVAPQDRKALKEWVEYHAAEGDFNKFMASLPSLPTGEAWIWSPEFLQIFKRITIRKRETFHPDREKLGDQFVVPELDAIDIKGFIAKFSANITKAMPGKIKDMHKDTHPSSTEITDKHLQNVTLKNENESLQIKLVDTQRQLDRVKGILQQVIGLCGGTAGEAIIRVNVAMPPAVNMWKEKLGSGGARRTFEFFADHPAARFTREQVALGTAQSARSGSFSNNMSKLTKNRLVLREGNIYFINPNL